ncbi:MULTISPECIES: CHAT domain-containing protein [Okeania]|uniref:CHAT domain-containing protein n=1 Tax=Okeania hirsuta TaxID=1458930 RepID=A0A3N6NS90_9CYAN|nr:MULTISPECIES: CHAT domain-containing protein [Okeania]NET78325.1 CHAT domain-containing protein [Okeania sp. SIO1F9]RQH12277.1 CHAT domain-containing protein [Okeania hirsuta]RQH27434.1 CHAT domain-containing protein [Okeania hirsuta]
MNQNRIQAYINLIQQLLNSPTERKDKILATNQKLLDKGLLQTIIMMAQTSAEKGNEEAQELLLTFAVELSEKLDISITENTSATATPLEYLEFLTQVLQATHESKNNPQIIHPILQENLNKLDQGLVETLQTWATSTLVEIKPEEAHSIAADIVNFSNQIQEFTLGDKADNLEIAITGYKTALTVYNNAYKTHNWVSIINNLGTAYLNRIYGDKSVNIEQVIEIYQSALKLIDREDIPQDWARIQSNLGNAYSHRIEGDKAKNIEQSIIAYERALEIITQENFPQQWATIQNNLANTYLTRITGKVGDNIELAINAYQKALQMIDREKNSLDWAVTQSNLGNAYLNRMTENVEKNIEQAITAYQQALKIINRENKPYQWANIQKNLGIAYLNRFIGQKSKNIELAITAYQQALTEITPIDSLLDWVIISINLGTAYLHRDTAEIIENIELSIVVYQQVLQVINPEKFALWWGIIQKNLGDAYSYKVRENKVIENIENIADFYQNIELAITAYQQALNIFTVESFPLECLQIYRKLGDLGFQNENWQLAIESYQIAIKLLETTQSLANTEISYKEMLAESIYMYGNIVECYVKIEEYEQALEYVEASRSRRLVELMMINDIYKNEEKPAEVEEYYDLQQQINQLNFDTTRINKPITVGSRFSIKEIKSENQEKIALLKEKQQKIWQKIWNSDRVLAEQLQVTYLSFSEIQQLVKDKQTAIIDFYSTRNNTYIFLLNQQQLTVHICQGEGIDKLQTWIHDNWLKLHAENSSEWQNQMEAFLSELSEKLEFNQLIKQLNEIKELIIIPHLYLHQIPYVALPVTREKETKYLCDYFRLRILPSCQILNYCSERTLINNPRKIGIVETPITNKFYTRYECETLANMYLISPQKRLQYSQAKINNYHNFIQQVQVLHSSHISQVNLVNPLSSKLKLFDGDIVLSKVFAWRLPELFDVFLSSCEINLNQTKISDDILTFASAFISAGARHIISSLWLVEDLATALFCIFYYQHRQKYSCSEALKKAQNQLRYLTGTQLSSYRKQLEGYLEQYMKQENSEKIQQKKELLSWFCQQSLPFTHPYYWAGFISQGIS